MARIIRTENNETVNTNQNETGYSVTTNSFIKVFDVAKSAFSTRDREDLWAVTLGLDTLAADAVFWALNAETKGFDCEPDLSTKMKALEALSEYFDMDFDPTVSINYTKESFFKRADISLRQAMASTLHKYGQLYGINKRMDELEALKELDAMDTASKEYKELEESAKKHIEGIKAKTQEIWDKVDGIQNQSYLPEEPEEGIEFLALEAVPGNQKYYMLKALERRYEFMQRKALFAAKMANESGNTSEETNKLASVASYKLIIAEIGQILHEAEKVDQTNTSAEPMQQAAEEDGSVPTDSEVARHRYEVENNLPHGTIGNGSGNGDSIYDGTTEEDEADAEVTA